MSRKSGEFCGDARDALVPFERALQSAEIPASKRFEQGDPGIPPFYANEWRGLHMAVEAQVMKAALDKKPLDKMVWQGLLDKIEEIAPFTKIDG